MAQGLTDYWILSDAIGFAAGTTVVAEIPAKTLVVEARLLVTTLYVTGDAATVDIGDADNDDGWVDNQDVTATTAGMYKGTVTNGAAYADTGKYYTSGGQIKAKVAGANTAGAARVLLHCLSLPL